MARDNNIPRLISERAISKEEFLDGNEGLAKAVRSGMSAEDVANTIINGGASLTITGTLTAGSELTATLPDTYGATGYQWYRGDTEISGAASSTYTLTSSDAGQDISVIATGVYVKATGVAVDSGALRILLVGDSTIFGKGAGTGTDGLIGAHQNCPAVLLSNNIESYGHTAESKSVVGLGGSLHSSETAEAYFDDSDGMAIDLNGWTNYGFSTIGGSLMASSVDGNYLTMTFDDVDTIAIGLPIRAYGIIGYRIDGGEWVEVSESGSDELRRIEIHLELGSHTIEFNAMESVEVFVSYVEAWNNSLDVVVIPWGARGYSSADIVNTTRPWSYGSAISTTPFDILAINVGINDVRTDGSGTSQVDYEANLTTFIESAKLANPESDIYLIIPSDIDVGLDYVPSSIQSVASQQGCVVIDSRSGNGMSTYAIASSSGNMFDNLHPNSSGYSNIWEELSSTIASSVD